MSVPEIPKEQLVDLLVQLKILAHSQPDTARTIMASQPQLPHLLLRQLFELELVDSELLLATLQSFAQAQAGQPPAVAAPAPVPAASNFVHATPAYIAPAPTAPYAPPPAQVAYLTAPGYATAPAHPGYPAYSTPAPAPAPAPAAVAAISPAALAAMTDEQRQAILRVVQMTPEELATIPPNERGVYIELRRQFGIV